MQLMASLSIHHLRNLITILLCIVLLTACGSGGTSTSNTQIDTNPLSNVNLNNADICDFLVIAHCLYPFPNNHFTRTDSDSATGLRINFSGSATPSNKKEERVKVEEWNKSDGFSPGSMILTYVPAIDLTVSGAPTLTNLERSLDNDTPIMVIDALTGEKQLIWAELDSNVSGNKSKALIIRPAKNFKNGRRYIVALRHIKTQSGESIEAPQAFKIFRDHLSTENNLIENRRNSMENILSTLEQYGVNSQQLYMAWDFTVASAKSITGRVLHMRDDALDRLGDNTPDYTISEEYSISSNLMEKEFHRDNLNSIVRGLIKVPNYLDELDGNYKSNLNIVDSSPDALPTQLRDETGALVYLNMPFVCAIPHSVISQAGEQTETPVIIMAHGLFLSKNVVLDLSDYGNQHKAILCGMDWTGMSQPPLGGKNREGDTHEDIGPTNLILQDISLFPRLPDRLQQAYLNNIFFTTLLSHAQGLQTNEYFQREGQPLFNRNNIYFEGVSQGSIVGGGFFAIDPNIERGVFLSGGMNFSLLLRRSMVWQHLFLNSIIEQIGDIFSKAYTSSLSRPLLLAMIQMLWDRAEINGYANQFNQDSLSNTPKSVLIQSIVGDQTVPEISAEILARTIGAKRHSLSPVADRHIADTPYYGIDTIDTEPFQGNALIVWDRDPYPTEKLYGEDFGTPLPWIKNSFDQSTLDSHAFLVDDEFVGSEIIQAPRAQRIEFLTTGQLSNICNNSPCFTSSYLQISEE